MTPAEALAVCERLLGALAPVFDQLVDAGGDVASWTTGFDSGMRVALERPALARELAEAFAISTFTRGDDEATLAVLAEFRDKRPSTAQLEAGILYLQAIASLSDDIRRRREAAEVGAELHLLPKTIAVGDGQLLEILRRAGAI